VAQQTDVYKKIVKKYIKDAEEYFQKCKVIPDTGDLAGCIFDFWQNDACIDLTDDDYRGLMTALGFDFEDEYDNEESEGDKPDTNTPPAFQFGPVPGQV
jgi:hypothetical protein